MMKLIVIVNVNKSIFLLLSLLIHLLFILVLTDFSDFLRGAEQTASGVDVLAAAGTDGGEDTMLGEVITELLHLLIIHTLQRNVWNLVETNQVEAAVKSLHQLDDGLGMLHTVVYALRSEERRVGKECRSRWSPYH